MPADDRWDLTRAFKGLIGHRKLKAEWAIRLSELERHITGNYTTRTVTTNM